VRSRDEIVFNVSSVFFHILAQRHVVSSVEFSRSVLEEHLRRVTALAEAGKAAGVDRIRTEVRLADVGQRLVRERNVLAIQKRTLVALMGVDLAAGALHVDGRLDENDLPPLPSLERGIAVALERRADLAAARAMIGAQRRLVEAAGGESGLSVSLVGSYEQRAAFGSTTGAGDQRDDLGRVGFAVSIPLFDGGRIAAKVREESADLARMDEELRQLEIAVRLEVETAVLEMQSAREQIDAVSQAVGQAEEGLRIERQKYELGRGTIVDVLDAQSAHLEMQTSYYRALAAAQVAGARLRLVMGGSS
jgi:outer membrane protein